MPLEQSLRPLPAGLEAAGSRIVVAYSGGLDSTVLLHALRRVYGARVHALHVHHGMQTDADAWAEHCLRICKEWAMPIEVAHVQVSGNGRGLEDAAREARRAAFSAHLSQGDILALAHHQDDQAETFLLNALRGSGSDGLSAMPMLQFINNAFYWRPWLQVPRTQLAHYAQKHALEWIEDPTNATTRFDRNYLRLSVMPLLRARWPHAAAAFARAAELQAQTRSDLDATTREMLAQCRLAEDDLRVDALMRFSVEDRARVLRAWVASLGLPPLGSSHLQQIERDVLAARQDATPVFEWAQARMLRWRDVLHASKQDTPAEFAEVRWDGTTPLPLPDGRRLRLMPAGAQPQSYTLVARRGGERIRLPGRSHHTEVKKLLQALGVPAWQRSQLPLLVDESGEVHAIPGWAVSETLSSWLQRTGSQLVHDTEIDPACLD